MMTDKKHSNENPPQTNPAEKVEEAHTQAEKDIQQDPDLNDRPDPAADLDEGELARLESGEKE